MPKLFNVSACIACTCVCVWGYLVITGSGLHFVELNILNGFREANGVLQFLIGIYLQRVFCKTKKNICKDYSPVCKNVSSVEL